MRLTDTVRLKQKETCFSTETLAQLVAQLGENNLLPPEESSYDAQFLRHCQEIVHSFMQPGGHDIPAMVCHRYSMHRYSYSLLCGFRYRTRPSRPTGHLPPGTVLVPRYVQGLRNKYCTVLSGRSNRYALAISCPKSIWREHIRTFERPLMD